MSEKDLRQQYQQYQIDRFYVSDRGMHFCFRTSAEAKKAFDDFFGLGADYLILEGSQLVDPRLKRGIATAE